MCIIIDVQLAHKVFREEKDPDEEFKPIRDGLLSAQRGYIKLIYGGQLAVEYQRDNGILRFVLQLQAAGRARRVPDDEVNAETSFVCDMGYCKSDDEHIIALARVSGARLLCSHDQALHADFTDKRLLDGPRGKVYQCSEHKGLLREFCKPKA
jgi:hypothetical protein